jgi:hypothetical protein
MHITVMDLNLASRDEPALSNLRRLHKKAYHQLTRLRLGQHFLPFSELSFLFFEFS